MKDRMAKRGKCGCEGKERAPSNNCEKDGDDKERELMRQIGSILKRNQNEQFLTLVLTRARNLEKILNQK
ncbi:MAG: hypothetical protein K0S60_700 [Evtepia sp.]|nr:hypothetical protein [Evtepia sp.]